MIIYGRGTKKLGTTVLAILCPRCGATSLTMTVIQHYFHIFWIPFFPAYRSSSLHCPRCTSTVDESELSSEDRGFVRRERMAFRTPLYLFAGCFLVAAGMAAGGIIHRYDAKRLQEYRQTPQSGDWIVVKAKKESGYPYHIARVKKVDQSKVWLLPATLAYSEDEAAQRAIEESRIRPDDFDPEPLTLSETAYGRLDITYIKRDKAWPEPLVEDTPLMQAADTGDRDMASRLISSGVPMNAVDSIGNTALLRACDHGQTEIVRLLLKHGANVHVVNHVGGQHS